MLNEIIVTDLGRNKLCMLNDNVNAARHIKQSLAVNEITTLSFEMAVVRNGKWTYLQPQALVLFNGEYYIIRNISFAHNQDNSLVLQVEARHYSDTLATDVISLTETTPLNVIDLMKRALCYEGETPTLGWKVGKVTVDRVAMRGLEALEQSPFSILLTIAEKYNGILKFNSVDMTVDMLERQPTDRPLLDLRVSKNLKSFNISYDTSEMYTRLYCYGKSDDKGIALDITSVNPTGKGYLENFDYYKSIGYTDEFIKAHPHLFVSTNVWKDDSFFDAQDLYDQGLKQIEEYAKPKVDVQIQALDTKAMNLSGEMTKLELGTCIAIHDEDIGVDTLCNVVRRSIDYDSPHILNCEVTNSITYHDTLSKLFTNVNNATNIITSGGDLKPGHGGGTSMEDVKGYLNLYYLNAEQIDAKYATIGDLKAHYVTVEELKANYIDANSIAAKYATIGQLKAVEAKIENLDVTKLEAEFAEIKKLVAELGEFDKLIANKAEIDELKANNITVMGTLKANKAELEELIATKVTVGDFNAYKATIEKLFALYATIEHLEANYIKADKIEATYAKITELDVVKGNFETLKVDLANVEKLVANKADIEDLNVINATIETLKADLIKVNELVATKVDAQYVQAEIVKANQVITDDLKAIHAIVDVLDTKYATIEQLNAKVAEINTLIAKKASIEELNAAKADIGKLDALVANIESIMAGNIGTGNLQTIHLTAKNMVVDDAIIKSAMIDTIDTKVVNIATSDGGLKIVGNTQQWFDKSGKIRMQAGQDEQGNFNFAVFGSDGTTTILNENGITEYAVPNGIIRDDMVADDANIQAKKIQYVDKDGNKTLQTVLGIEQGRIEALIKETTIENGDGSISSLKDKYAELSVTVNGFSGAIADVATKVDEATGKVTEMESKVTKIEATADGVQTIVSSNKDRWDKGAEAGAIAESAKTIAQQAADKFSWIVKSGTSSTNFELTDRTAELVAQNINLKGLVTFSGLNSDVKDKISSAESNANDAKDKIDNLNVGGRNYFVNASKFTKEQPFTGVCRQQSEWWYEFGEGVFIYTKESFKAGDEITIQCESSLPWTDVYDMDDPKNVQKAGFGLCIGTKENIQTAGPTRVDFIAGDGVSKKLVKTYTLPTVDGLTDMYLGFRFTIYSNYTEDTNGSFWNLKVEKGNKSTDWTPAPEDKANQQIIDDWTNSEVQEGVTAINGGNIQTGSIKAIHIDVEDLIVDGGALMNKINAQEINTNRLVGDSIHANMLSLYGMRVLNKDTNKETLTIDNIGNVTLRGTLESFDFVSGKSGWALNADGNMELNDLTARGSIINNMGGIASGGNGNPNLIKSSRLDKVWGYAGGYKFDVTVVDDSNSGNGQHYDFKCTTVGNSAGFYLNLFTEEQGLEIGKTYTWSFWAKSSVERTGRVGHESGGTATITIPTDWKYYSYTWKALETTNKSFVIYVGQQLNDVISIRDFKIEEGSDATSWTIPTSDDFKKVIFWAGSTYDMRDSAPFRVYSDGSTVSTKGEYSGLWTGDVRIGNISIVDPSTTGGNDANLTIQNGQNGVKRVQLSDSNSSMFAQDLIISSNAYSPTIALKQDGSANFGEGIYIGSKTSLNDGRLILNGQYLNTREDGFVFRSNNVSVGYVDKTSSLDVYGKTVAHGDLKFTQTLFFGDVVKATVLTNGVNFEFIE